jgi:hypothetical protein
MVHVTVAKKNPGQKKKRPRGDDPTGRTKRKQSSGHAGRHG